MLFVRCSRWSARVPAEKTGKRWRSTRSSAANSDCTSSSRSWGIAPPRGPEIGRPRELLLRRGPGNEAEAPGTRRRPCGTRDETRTKRPKIASQRLASAILGPHRRPTQIRGRQPSYLEAELPANMKKEAIQTDLPATGLPFSWGVRLQNFVFLAGHGPLGSDGKVVDGDIRPQTRKTLENFRKVVEAAGSSLEHVVSTTVYLKDLEDFRGMNEVYAEFFAAEPRPARATVRADLLLCMKVEIQGIAYVPGGESLQSPGRIRASMAKKKKSKKAAKKKAYYAGRKEKKAKK